MDIIALSALRTGSVVWQPRRGIWVLTVICKATFSLSPTESNLAEEQEYPNEDDNHWNDDPARSLYSPADLVPFKPRADVMLVGHAFAPRKDPARSVVARLIVGDVSKAIEVWCDRSFAQDGSLREGPRFVKMPLRWERASGGPDSQNPVGVRHDARPDAYGTISVPNLQPPGQLLTSPRDFIEPICFGPIAATWPARRERLGRHAATWPGATWSQQPMPEDIDPGYFNTAPRDQQVETIRPNERIVLENLHPEHARLVTNLPGIAPRGFVERRGSAPQELAFVCDTLWIDTDRAICTLTWRAQIPIEYPAQPGRVLITSGDASTRATWAEVERLAASHEADSAETTSPRIDGGGLAKRAEGAVPQRKAQTLPFMRSMDFPLSPAPPEPPKPRVARPRDRLQETFDDTTATGPATVMRASSDGAADASPPWLAQARAALGAVSSSPTFDANQRPSTPPVPPGSPFGAPPAYPPPPATPFVPRPNEPAIVRPADAAPPVPPAVVQPPIVSPSVVQPPMVPPPVVVPVPPVVVPAPAVVSLASPSIGQSMAAPLPRESSGGPPPNLGSIAPPAPVQQAPAMVNTAAAATVGVAAVSNAAAANARAAANAQQQAAAAPTGPASSAPSSPPKTGTKAKEIVDVLWFDPPALPRIRGRAEWKAILEKAKPEPEKPKKKSLGFDDDDDDDKKKKESAPAPDPPEIVDRRDLSSILARGEVMEPDWLNDAVGEAVGDDGAFMPPLVLTGGEIVLPFDEVEQLKATVTTVGPFIGTDKKLKEAVDNARELLDGQALAGGGSGVADGLTTRIREAFQATSRMVPATYLDAQTERALLEQRHYQKRTVFGAPWLRAVVSTPGGGNGVPAYLPEELAKKLPMFQRFRARIIAELHLAQDQYETSAIALKVVGLARVMPIGIGAGAAAKPTR